MIGVIAGGVVLIFVVVIVIVVCRRNKGAADNGSAAYRQPHDSGTAMTTVVPTMPAKGKLEVEWIDEDSDSEVQI